MTEERALKNVQGAVRALVTATNLASGREVSLHRNGERTMNERTIRVEKEKLLEKIKANRKRHHEVVVDAQKHFREKVIEELDIMLEDARKGKRMRLHIGLAPPMDHTQEYDTIIGMLEMDVDDFVDLTEHEYRCYIEDQWEWSRQWAMTNSAYSNMVG